MSDNYQRIEVITGMARRRRWATEEKLRIVDETLRSGESISVVAMASRRTCSIVGGG